MDHIDYTKQPIFFKRNRVKRVYDGGKLFADFFGDDSEDGKYPEEWVASAVTALNKDSVDLNEGLSFIENTDITLYSLLNEFPKETLGGRNNLGVLVKLLDSSIRLPIQAHPDPVFSRKYFNSSYGKTEMWLILATRENAYICFGFKNKINAEEFQAAIDLSETDKEAFTPLLNKVYVTPGEVYLIPAKAVHAIGYGCLLLEVQEPTDFTIQPEHWCGDYKLNDYEMYLNIPHDIALECFDFSIYGKDSLFLSKKEPTIVLETIDVIKECLISYDDTPCFSVNRYTLSKGSLILESTPAIYIVTKGSGQILGLNYSKDLIKGDFFLLPHHALRNFSISTNNVLVLIECLPSLT